MGMIAGCRRANAVIANGVIWMMIAVIVIEIISIVVVVMMCIISKKMVCCVRVVLIANHRSSCSACGTGSSSVQTIGSARKRRRKGIGSKG